MELAKRQQKERHGHEPRVSVPAPTEHYERVERQSECGAPVPRSAAATEHDALSRHAPNDTWDRHRWVVADGFQRVADAFEKNFTEHADVGAAFAAVVNGEIVVDVWGGDAKPGYAWHRDTLQVIWSGTKGLVATCLLVLLDRDLLRLTDPVCRHWPEFAANGKGEVLVGELVSHRGRMPGIYTRLLHEDITDDARMASLLAGQAQETDPRAIAAYHALTFGWLCGELVRRISGQSIGRFFAEEVAKPLGLELWIGLPSEFESRVATLRYSPDWGRKPPLHSVGNIARDRLLASALANPPIFPPDSIPWNSPEYHVAEIPAAGAVGTARSIAWMYGCLASGGRIGDVRLVSQETIDLGRRELSRFWDPLTGQAMRYGVGFQLQAQSWMLGPVADAFGHTGAGGSIHAAWPTHHAGVSYVMSEMRDDPTRDERALGLLRAVNASLTARAVR
jgi:CubicO group peptidase (beta-lactamase class C family)